MKRNPFLLLAATALLAVCANAAPPYPATSADPFLRNPGGPGKPPPDFTPLDPVLEPQWINSMLILEIYAMPREEALRLLEGLTGHAARYARALELARNGKARLETLTALAAKSGQRAVSQSFDEVRYPTSFAAPAGKGGLAAPVTYEVRDVGDSLEEERVMEPGGLRCDVSLTPLHVSLNGFRDIPAMAGDSPVSQPVFGVRKLAGNTFVDTQAPHFLGTLNAFPDRNAGGGDEARVAFLRVNTAPPAPAAKPVVPEPEWRDVEVEFSFYSLPRAAAREIIVASRETTEAWAKMQALPADQQARCEHLISVKCRNGQREAIGELEETSFATAYEPSREGTKGLEPGYPASLEKQATGYSITLDILAGMDLRSVTLSYEVSYTSHLGPLKAAGVAAEYPAQPLFETRKITSSMDSVGGEHNFLGTFNPPGVDGVNERADTGRTWMVFARPLPLAP